MDYVTGADGQEDAIIRLFAETFTASEGDEEGQLIGGLVQRLIETTAPDDLVVVTARDAGALAGGICFTRLRYAGDPRAVFVLAPVAVATPRQGEGIGQALIRHGLEEMRQRGAEVALTYGDPAFYGRVGFRPITEDQVPAPFPLSLPHGWLGQSLTDDTLGTIAGPATPVEAFDDPVFW